MSKITGTLWEHSEGGESLNHGFGSYVAAEIVECLKQLRASERKMTGHLPDGSTHSGKINR